MIFSLISIVQAAVTHNCDSMQPNVERYTVTGDTADQARATMGRACGPGGDCFDGYINYNLAESIVCSNGVYRVMMANRIQMPQLLTTRNPVLRSSFDTFERNLYQHELNHLEHARQTCRFFVAELEKDSGNCSFSLDRIYQIQSDGWSRASTLDRDYDANTGHGMTEGACFGTHCSDQCQGCRDRFIAANSFTPPSDPSTGPAPGTTTVPVIPPPVVSPPVVVTVSPTGSTPTRSTIIGSTTLVTGSGTTGSGETPNRVVSTSVPSPSRTNSATKASSLLALVLLFNI